MFCSDTHRMVVAEQWDALSPQLLAQDLTDLLPPHFTFTSEEQGDYYVAITKIILY